MGVEWFFERLASFDDDPAVVDPASGRVTTYAELLESVGRLSGLEVAGALEGVVALVAEFRPTAVALFLALMRAGAVAVPLSAADPARHDEFVKVSRAGVVFRLGDRDDVSFRTTGYDHTHHIYSELAGRPGLVLFSSGSTGPNKAAVHDLAAVLEKFRKRRHRLTTIPFLLFDHIGGVNTMLYVLSNGGLLVPVFERTPDAVGAAVERWRVELLPTSPTFLNLMLRHDVPGRYDLSSLRRVTYGTEPMPQATLDRLAAELPGVTLQQTYGLSELGILRSKSEGPGSLWVRLGGEGFELKVVGGTLRVRAESSMLGYLNAPSPFDADGFLDTKDLVETKEVGGEVYYRFRGRTTDVINVGGLKVNPSEVESVILEMPGVEDCVVTGEADPVRGQHVKATVRGAGLSRTAVRKWCAYRLEQYKCPVRVVITTDDLHGKRFKRVRS